MKRMELLPALLLVFCSAQAADATQEVLDCMRANVPPAMRVQDIELTTTDRSGGMRVVRGKLYAMREPVGDKKLVRAALRVSEPTNLAGAAYLVRQNEDYLSDGMFVYLPAVKRVRRVTGTFADGSLLGSDFSYNDFKQLQNAFGNMTAQLEGGGNIDRRATNVVLFKAAPGHESRYSAVRVWVDKEHCVPLQAEFYEGDAVRKMMISPPQALRQSGKHWFLSEVEMRDLKEGTHTVLRLQDVAGKGELPGRHFDPNLFYLSN